eukprot:g19622.t1
MAFGGPAAFGRRLSGESEKSAATASDADGCASREMSDLRPESASHNKQLLKPAIKKGEGTAKPAGTKPKKVRAKARLKFEEDAVGMELPPESADPAADLNAPAKPLAGKLADANAANVKLQMELEHLRRVSAEFERLGGGDVGVLNAIVETRDLEKQLQASTAEVQELRTERKGIDAAHAFSQQADCLESKNGAICFFALQMVQQLHKEMEELRGRHKNLQDQYENCKAECSRLNDLHGRILSLVLQYLVFRCVKNVWVF